MDVMPLFATPIGQKQLVHCRELNSELEALFLQREADEYRNPTPSHIPQAETFESRFNLFRWPVSCVQQLRAFMLDSVMQMVFDTTDLRPDDVAHLKFRNHAWFHISRFAGSFVAHNHPLASWSAVYCVRAGETPAAHADSGVLRLFDTRHGANAYTDLALSRLKRTYALAPLQVRLVEGQLIVFPSYLFHEVAPFYGRDTRITVAINCWFE